MIEAAILGVNDDDVLDLREIRSLTGLAETYCNNQAHRDAPNAARFVAAVKSFHNRQPLRLPVRRALLRFRARARRKS